MAASPDDCCFHCGSALPPASDYSINLEGVRHRLCCAGCQAAVELVLSQGLGRFYRFRSGAAPMPNPGRHDWSVFDRDASLRRYTQSLPDGNRAVSLQLEGLRCAACAWLIHNSLLQLPGVHTVLVDVTAARAELRYDPRRVSLSALLRRLCELGYVGRPLSFTAADGEDDVERRAALQRLAVAGFGMMQVMTFAISLYAGALQGMDANLEHLMRLVSMIVATPVVLFAAQPFFSGAWRSLRARVLGMDVPVALSIGAAYVCSVWSTLVGHGAVYFDSAVMFTFFLLLGRYLEMSLRHRSGLQQLALARLLPDSVLRLRGTIAERITPEELLLGDRLRVLPGERIAADGIIEQGSSEVDESLLSGESLPRARKAGDELTAGTLNLTESLELRVLRIGQDSTLAAISRLLARAQASRPQIADQADRIAAWFVGSLLLLALAVGIYWTHADPAHAFPTVLALLVVSCPCALSLGTPAALAAATARLARSGLLVARGRAVDRLALADCVVFDKTGTLTRGQLRLEQTRVFDPAYGVERCLAIAAALERYSAHPVASAFAAVEPALNVRDVASSNGRGIEASIDGVRYRIGRWDYALELCPANGSSIGRGADDSMMAIALTSSAGVLACFSLGDSLRADAGTTLHQLQTRGLDVWIASGDRASVVAAVAAEVGGIKASAGLDAAAKVALVRTLQEQGHSVLMVGDGVNDAPVLAAADVSIAISVGSDLAQVSADLVLRGERLAPLLDAIGIARCTRRIIRQNLVWAGLYNATAVPLAALGYLQPWMAAIGMSASSLLVVLNTMRLLRHSRDIGGALSPGSLGMQPA